MTDFRLILLDHITICDVIKQNESGLEWNEKSSFAFHCMLQFLELYLTENHIKTER